MYDVSKAECVVFLSIQKIKRLQMIVLKKKVNLDSLFLYNGIIISFRKRVGIFSFKKILLHVLSNLDTKLTGAYFLTQRH